MDVNVKVTVDLGDKTMSLFSGFMAANNAVATPANTAGEVLKEHTDGPAESEGPEFEKPTRARRSRKAADEAPARLRRAEADHEPDNESDDNDSAGPEPAARSNDLTHDDIRNLMAEVITNDENNRPKVLKQLSKVGAKSVGTIKDEDLADFFEFLQSLKNA